MILPFRRGSTKQRVIRFVITANLGLSLERGWVKFNCIGPDRFGRWGNVTDSYIYEMQIKVTAMLLSFSLLTSSSPTVHQREWNAVHGTAQEQHSAAAPHCRIDFYPAKIYFLAAFCSLDLVYKRTDSLKFNKIKHLNCEALLQRNLPAPSKV
jgi:hypothetical protein